MPAAKLPKNLPARLDFLAARVRKVRLLRGGQPGRLVFPVAALVGILADVYLGLPAGARIGLFAGWAVLLFRELRNVVRARRPGGSGGRRLGRRGGVPRLAERLTTAVELAGHADESNGAPALVDEVIQDADSRARKLDWRRLPDRRGLRVGRLRPARAGGVPRPRGHHPPRRRVAPAVLPPLVHAASSSPTRWWSRPATRR